METKTSVKDQMHSNDFQESITSSQCMDQISSFSTTDLKNTNCSIEKRATHSEIEKRRRQKMNKHLNELAFHLPGVSNKNKKPDKLTILKLAVQHLKNLKATNTVLNDSFICQNLMKPIELQSLVLNEPDEFFIVIKCDSSKILFTNNQLLNFKLNKNELIDRSFFEIIHSSDHKQVKDQLAYQETKNAVDSSGNYIASKKRLYTTGDRRSFSCRLRTSSSENNKKQLNLNESEYKLVNFAGYMRSDFNFKYDNNECQSNACSSSTQQTDSLFKSHHSSTFLYDEEMSSKSSQLTNQPTSDDNTLQHYLLAYAQIKSKVNEYDQQAKFTTKHDTDGKFLYIEPSIYPILGYLPQQLLSESLYSYVHADDALMLKKCFHEAILTSPAKVKTCEYRVRLENNKSYASVESVLFALKNPFTNILEYIVSQNKFCSTGLNHIFNQQPQLPIQKKKLVQSPMAFVSMPMTPSPEDNQNSEIAKYNDSLQSKKIANNFRTNKINQLNTAISFNSNQKMKQKDSLFHLDNSNLLLNQFNILPIAASNQNDIFKQSRNQDDSYLNFNGNNNNQENNLFNENNQNQIIYEITDNFNDFLVKNQQSTSDDVRSMEKRQNSYNLMMKNNSVQENTEMLMEILKNEKNFQTSLHSNSSNQKT